MPENEIPTPNSQLPATDFQLRSEDVQEILTRAPNWMIRWGNVVILSILILMLIISWVVKYPDLISSQIIITTSTPPEKLLVKAGGKIEAILVNDRTIVAAKTPLAVIENSANYKDVFKLKEAVELVSLIDKKNNSQKKLSDFDFQQFKNSQLGEVEGAYALFQKEFTTNKLNAQLRPYEIEGNAQGAEWNQLNERLNLLKSQKVITQSELELQKNDLDRNQTLFKKGIIAAQELDKHKLIYLQAQKSYQAMLASISQLKSSLNDLNKNTKTTQINKTKDNVNLERNEIQAFYALKKAIKDWELNYVLRASINGKVSFLQIWKENQTVNSGENVFTVIPINQKNFIGKVKAPILNSGKLRKGQEVNIRLDNYPDREFGIVRGKVKNISLTPDKEGKLLIDVDLPDGIQTSYHKKIIFHQEMSGNADIVTEDLRLIERILYQFKDVFRRH